MNAATRQAIRRRAGRRCEYCLFPDKYYPASEFHVEHIIPRKHGGESRPRNLCWSCQFCNLHKGPNLTGFDPLSKRVAMLYNPRSQRWRRHFQVNGPLIVGISRVGRATFEVLAMNEPSRVDTRRLLQIIGVWPG